MKKLSLFSLSGLAGLLAFVVTPIYAQDVEEDINVDENIIVEAENLDVDDEINYGVDGDEIALETVEDEDTIEGNTDLDEEDNLKPIENIDASINDVIGIIDSDESEDEDLDYMFNITVKIGDEIYTINSFSFFLTGIGLAILVCFLAWLILCHIALWKLFGRAGEAKWKSLIPLYNLYIVFKISGLKKWFWWIIVVAVISGIIESTFPNFGDSASEFSAYLTDVVSIVLGYCLSRKFGRSKDSAILYALFSPICILILGLGNYKFQGKKSDKTVVEA